MSCDLRAPHKFLFLLVSAGTTHQKLQKCQYLADEWCTQLFFLCPPCS
uniref:Pleiotropic drug resistance protein 3 n=1 Tax=Rhizophora mucronata TaxID=61149 RepID=A0A2P2JV17_RHIMU